MRRAVSFRGAAYHKPHCALMPHEATSPVLYANHRRRLPSIYMDGLPRRSLLAIRPLTARAPTLQPILQTHLTLSPDLRVDYGKRRSQGPRLQALSPHSPTNASCPNLEPTVETTVFPADDSASSSKSNLIGIHAACTSPNCDTRTLGRRAAVAPSDTARPDI
ncbi:hypothetical protein PYCCODRAFT_318144 [Trametes coccinea BRFM310]|uniref:Uncharacterized protein n=1 Tax=Trametes coccinea (strain BRFM310) TaxID=1353009 RepID=A0A1Y2IN55_TRAC3|nr:hypothetical protein PYCCODRAFT_318144 [Trametes coccinea BRFM310]